jgi:hypothetical protein
MSSAKGTGANERKLVHRYGLLNTLEPPRTANLERREERAELITVSYDKLLASTSCVPGVQELVSAAQQFHFRSGAAPGAAAAGRVAPNRCACAVQAFS